MGFPGGSACSMADLGLILGLERSPGEGNGYPLQYSCLENFINRGARQGSPDLGPADRGPWEKSPWGHKELDTTE